MKTARTLFAIIGLFFLLFLIQPAAAFAQQETTPSFSRAQLSQMLAPIALYPDDVLSQILMASTYPIEVIEADRWLRDHQDLQGDSLDQALQDKDWDASVKSLCHFPNVLTMMSNKIEETTNLGNAFLAQQVEVMDVVQELRHKALDQGNLNSNSKEKVIVENQTIIIRPVNPETVYIPYYNPVYVYGSWWYPDYPPYYWGPANVVIGGGIYFWPTPFFGFGIGWSYFDWPSHYIVIDTRHRRPRFFRHNEWREERGRWRHLPRHRRGVAYRDLPTARRFGQAPQFERHFNRDTRGFPERERNRVQQRPMIRRQSATPPRTEPRKKIQPTPSPSRRVEPQRQAPQRFEERQVWPPATTTNRRMEVQRQAPQRFEERRRQTFERRYRAEQRQESNVFNRLESGREEQNYSNRGRASRQFERRQTPAGGFFRRGNEGSRGERGRRR